MGYMSDQNYIIQHVTRDELLAQLAEEAAELAQAALKLRRAIRRDNPTPTPLLLAEEQLWEEIADVELCLSVVGATGKLRIAETQRMKAARWVERLKAREEDA